MVKKFNWSWIFVIILGIYSIAITILIPYFNTNYLGEYFHSLITIDKMHYRIHKSICEKGILVGNSNHMDFFNAIIYEKINDEEDDYLNLLFSDKIIYAEDDIEKKIKYDFNSPQINNFIKEFKELDDNYFMIYSFHSIRKSADIRSW